jgi:hypothetical protein
LNNFLNTQLVQILCNNIGWQFPKLLCCLLLLRMRIADELALLVPTLISWTPVIFWKGRRRKTFWSTLRFNSTNSQSTTNAKKSKLLLLITEAAANWGHLSFCGIPWKLFSVKHSAHGIHQNWTAQIWKTQRNIITSQSQLFYQGSKVPTFQTQWRKPRVSTPPIAYFLDNF